MKECISSRISVHATRMSFFRYRISWRNTSLNISGGKNQACIKTKIQFQKVAQTTKIQSGKNIYPLLELAPNLEVRPQPHCSFCYHIGKETPHPCLGNREDSISSWGNSTAMFYTGCGVSPSLEGCSWLAVAQALTAAQKGLTSTAPKAQSLSTWWESIWAAEHTLQCKALPSS